MKPKTRKISSLVLSIFINLFILTQSLFPSSLSSLQSGLFSKPLISIIEFFRPNENKKIVPEKLEITGESTVFINETSTFNVKFTPEKVSYPTVTWEVNNDFASIDTKGVLTAKKTGEVILTCIYQEDSSIRSSKAITIIEKPKEVPTRLVLSLNKSEALVNTSLPLNLTIDPHNNFEVVYTISNDCITIDEFNILKVFKAGTVSFYGHLKDYPNIRSETINLSCIEQPIVPVTEIDISINQVYIARTEVPDITIFPSTATDMNYILVSGDESIATINDKKIVGKGKGIVDITVMHGFDRSIIKTINIEVKEVLPETIHLSYATKDQVFAVGKTIQLRIQMSPSDITNRMIIWESSDETIAKVDKNGLVYGVKEGNFSITATSVSNSTISISRDYKVEKASSLGTQQRSLVVSIIRKGLGHFGLFAVSGLITTWCLYEFLNAKKKPLIISICIGVVLGTTAEIIQQIPDGRAPGVDDILINISGFLAGILAYFVLISWRKRRKNKK